MALATPSTDNHPPPVGAMSNAAERRRVRDLSQRLPDPVAVHVPNSTPLERESPPSGPLFHFRTPGKLVINAGTTIVTFLMLFLIRRTQNSEADAVAVFERQRLAAIEELEGGRLGHPDFRVGGRSSLAQCSGPKDGLWPSSP